MDALPTELLDEIVQHCDHSSQKVLRQTTRTLNNLATPLVFERSYFAPCTFANNLHDLEALIKFKKTLASHIKHVHFYADILPDWDESEFKRKALQLPDEERQIGVGPAFLKFEEYRKAQRVWYFQNDEYLRVFKELISSLPNLRSASVGIALNFGGCAGRRPLWSRLSSQIILSPDDWMFEQDEGGYFQDHHRTTCAAMATINLLEAIGFRSSFAGVTQVKQLHVHSLQSFRLETVMAKSSFDKSGITFSPQVESRFETLLGALDYLTDLNLEIPHPVRSEHIYAPGGEEQDRLRKLNGDEVCQMLRRAKNLKRLRFEYDSDTVDVWEPGDEDRHPLYSLFQAESNPWPSLQSLRLSVSLPHTLLLSFLGLLAGTLRDLDLRDMCVCNAQTLFAELPKVIAVETIYIECLWTKIKFDVGGFGHLVTPPVSGIICEGLDVDKPYEKALKAYLLGRAEDLPRLSGAEFRDDEGREASEPQQNAE